QVMVASAVVTATTLNFTGLGSISGTATLQGASSSAGVVISIPGTALSAVANSAGAYAIKNVPVGAQSLLATMPGYTATAGAATVTYNANVVAAAISLPVVTNN